MGQKEEERIATGLSPFLVSCFQFRSRLFLLPGAIRE